MDTTARRAAIRERIELTGEVDYASLAAEFSVSEMTIRRDVSLLETDGVVRRVLGGAIASPRGVEPAFSARVVDAATQKSDIANAVVRQLAPRETVILDSGSTVLAVARAIRGRDLDLRIITPSILVATELADDPGTDIILTGGRVRPGELSLIGGDAEAVFGRYNADTYIMGAAGLDLSRGATDQNVDESRMKRAAMASADRVILAIDRSKLGLVEFVTIAPAAELGMVITDGDAADPMLTGLASLGVEVVATGGETR